MGYEVKKTRAELGLNTQEDGPRLEEYLAPTFLMSSKSTGAGGGACDTKSL